MKWLEGRLSVESREHREMDAYSPRNPTRARGVGGLGQEKGSVVNGSDSAMPREVCKVSKTGSPRRN